MHADAVFTVNGRVPSFPAHALLLCAGEDLIIGST